MAHYLLPCRCGAQIEVSTGQAGRTVRCECGTELDVPNIRGLEQLTLVASEEAAAAWTWRHAVRLLGLLVALGGIGTGIYLQLQRPSTPEWAELRRSLDNEPIESLFQFWTAVQKTGVYWSPGAEFEPWRADATIQWWSIISFIIGGLGLLVIGATFFVPRSNSVRNARRSASAAAK